MNYEIYKKDNLIYIKSDAIDKQITFDIIKKLSEDLLKKKIETGESDYQITADDNLTIYKETLSSVFESVINDNDFIELYKENYIKPDNKEENNEKNLNQDSNETNNSSCDDLDDLDLGI